MPTGIVVLPLLLGAVGAEGLGAQGIVASLKLLMEANAGERNPAVNVVKFVNASSLVDDVVNHCRMEDVPLSTFDFMEYTTEETFWQYMEKKRMAWRGVINVVYSNSTDDIERFLARLHYRFFTGTGLGIADARRMDLLYHTIFHVFLFESDNDFRRQREVFERYLEEALNLIVIAFEPNGDAAKIWYGKGEPDGSNMLRLVNEWSVAEGFNTSDYLVPPVQSVYSDMKGRHFSHPVMHKPPWNYVTIDEDGNFVEDNGGRDVTLMEIMASSLNFRVTSVDPQNFGVPRKRGSSWVVPDYNFSGILGATHRREEPFHFYLGDTTQTYQRNGAVEFSFFVLFDSGAIVSQAPKTDVKPDVILKPFTLAVWTAIGLSFVVVLITSFLGVIISSHL